MKKLLLNIFPMYQQDALLLQSRIRDEPNDMIIQTFEFFRIKS
jgi:hypothetical protein